MLRALRWAKASRTNIFPGWWLVVTGGILSLLGHGYYTYGFSALFKPISEELSFNRAGTSVAASIGRLEGGFEAPIAGWVTDRFGPRRIILFGLFMVGTALILMNFINSLWSFYLVWGVLLGTGVNIALALPMQTAIANWFVKKRGLASSTQMVFSGLSGVLIMPLIAWMITVQGWRFATLVGGIAMFLIGIPLAWRFLKQHRPEYYGLLPDGARSDADANGTTQMIDRGIKYAAEAQEVEFTLRQAMRTPAYWMLIVSNACHALAMPAINIHGIPLLTDMGVEPLKAAGMLAMMVSASIPTRLITGILADRVNKTYLRLLMGGAYALQGIGILIFVLNPTVSSAYAWFVVYGIGLGGGIGLMSPMRARYFGRKAFGSIGGSSSLFMTPIGVAAPIYFGWVYDTTGSYMSAFTVIMALMAFSAILMFFIMPPKPPAHITDIRKIL